MRLLQIGELVLRKMADSGRIRQGGVEVVQSGASSWSTNAAETLTVFQPLDKIR